ncbi:MAG: arylsulfatase [Actinomycetota bacterium]|nr:arylsulfatase [Actinomycetota bacterium]MDA3003983.1 arylsulfatase [Actinomycetota bacterium]
MSQKKLPRATPKFSGEIKKVITDSTPEKLLAPKAPADAPNILLIMLDDVGFGSFGNFGGPVTTPGLDKVANAGLIYNQFHTTALCSPTRAALLTGRNHHSVHMGGITEIANSFPGYDSAIPPESATVAQVLRMSGYGTACFGKWHLTPSWEQSPAGPFDRWPTGLGFDRFYGIMGAESSQYEPPVYDQTTPISPHLDKPDYHLTQDLADQAIKWMHRQKASSPNKPFFCYFSTPAVHAPHHVPREWIEKYKGKFDSGWDSLRDEIYQRQLKLGVIPPDTALTRRPEQIPSWDDYPERYRPIARRLMEVFAGFLAHTDAQIKRVIDALDDLEIADNTLIIYITGDNGASAEGTIHGAWSAPSFQNGVPEDPEWLLEHIDDFGTAKCENHFNVGWAWALDSPFQWMKQVASHFGGTRNAIAISWPKKIHDVGTLRTQFHHVVDIAPTIYEVAGITPPDSVNGIEQSPIHGTSMNYSFDSANAPSTHTSQYFEILGNRAIYENGWIASCFHGRLPWIRLQGFEFDGPQECWELYNIEKDFSQAVDLAKVHPEKLKELQALFDKQAFEYGVYPLRDPGSPRHGDFSVPHSLDDFKKIRYTSAHTRMPESSVINLKNCSYQVSAEIEVTNESNHGVIACQGGNMAGWSLYLDDMARPTFHYNWFGHEHTSFASAKSLNVGKHLIEVLFAYDGGFGAGGIVSMLVNKSEVAAGRIEKTVPIVFSMSGETFDVGIDTGSPVGPYPHNYECTAQIIGVTLEKLDEPPKEIKERMRDGEFRASLSTQ